MNQSNQAGQGSIGAYVTVLGYNGSITLSFDWVVQVSSMPQVSAGITTAVNTPLFTADLPNGTFSFGPNKSNAQPTAWTGIGTPTGLPGPTFSVLQNVNAPQISVQFGKALMNDMIEAGFSLTLPTNKQPVGTWINEFTGMPEYTQVVPTSPGYRGAGFNDPRLLGSGGVSQSYTYDQTHTYDLASLAGVGRAAAANSNANAAQAAVKAEAARAEAARAEADRVRAAEINQQAQARLQRQAGVGASSGGSSGGSSVSSADLSRANASSDPIGSLNDSQGWTGSSSSGSTWSYNASDYAGLAPPIIIDLDGDGVELWPLSSSTTFFDADSDSYQERTAWAGADDGLLVIDLDGDGQVTQAKEIAFAEWTPEQDSDLQALAKVFDSNQDGTFDSRDERFAEFRIWRDANSNGVVDAGEMMTLQEAGIQSMGLKTKDDTGLDLSDGCAANDRLFCLRA